jgi:hypothetical protein
MRKPDGAPMIFQTPITIWDTESELMRPGYMAPKTVCISTANDRSGKICSTLDPTRNVHCVAKRTLAGVSGGHNIAYDLACLVAHHDLLDDVLVALEESRIVDTMIIERLAEIYQGDKRGPLNLSYCCQRYGMQALDKGETQLSFGPLWGLPISSYSKEQVDYSLSDAEATLRLFRRQEARWLATGKIHWSDVSELTRRAFWLQICMCRGLRSDPISIDELFEVTSAEIDQLRHEFTIRKFLRPDGSKDMKAIRAWVSYAYDGAPPMTEESAASKRDRQKAAEQGIHKKPFAPQVCTDRATLEESGNPILEDFARYGETASVLNKDLPMLASGVDYPIHTRWGIAGTGRTTSSAPNIQNFRRNSPKRCNHCGCVYHAVKKICPKCGCKKATSLMGIRECIIPREGYVFLAIDHSGLELCTLAQQIVKMLNLRHMADDINAGIDLHSRVGCLIAGVPYDVFRQRYKDGDLEAALQRNCGKVYQFGRHGGMGEETLKYYAKQGYQLDLTDAFCHDLVHNWGPKANPDGAEYLRAIRRFYPQNAQKRYQVKCYGSNITRSDCTYSAAANHAFQHLGAMIESRVGWELMREQLTGRTRDGHRSPLGECFMSNFVHDEFVFEVPWRLVDDADQRLHYNMTEIPKPLLPDVRIRAESVAMDRWSKRAKRVEKNGKLGVWHYEA